MFFILTIIFTILCTILFYNYLKHEERKLCILKGHSTFGGVRRDFSSLAVWEAMTDDVLIGDFKGAYLECYTDLSPDADYEFCETDGIYFCWIKPND